MWVLMVLVVLNLENISCASYKGTNELEANIQFIRNSVTDIITAIDNTKSTEILHILDNTNKAINDVNNRLSILEKRTEIWSTYEHFVSSWLDQISSLERQLDIIIKGQERQSKQETLLNTIQAQLNKIDVDKFEHVLNTVEKNQRNHKAVNTSSHKLFSFIDEYTTRGVLSSLNRIESYLSEVVKEGKQSNQGNNNCSEETTEILEDIVAKVDILVDKIKLHESDSETESCSYNITTPEPIPEPITQSEPSQCHNPYMSNDWYTIQERIAISYISHEYLNYSMAMYEETFHTVTSFWWGLKNMADASECNLKLRIELWDFEDNFAWAEYEEFKVYNASTNYMLHVAGYSGNATDSLSSHDGIPFSTFDVNNDQAPACCPCAVTFGSGWWFHKCFESNLNGEYRNSTDIDYYNGIIWEGWLGNYSLKGSKMMIKLSK